MVFLICLELVMHLDLLCRKVTSCLHLGTARLKEDGGLMQQLADACLVVDALEPSVREELIRTVCNKELTAYQQIFEGTVATSYDFMASKEQKWRSWTKQSDGMLGLNDSSVRTKIFGRSSLILGGFHICFVSSFAK
eukprot:Gb_31032 [translate_table: standard]